MVISCDRWDGSIELDSPSPVPCITWNPGSNFLLSVSSSLLSGSLLAKRTGFRHFVSALVLRERFPECLPEEPGAVIPHAGTARGASDNWRPYLNRQIQHKDANRPTRCNCQCPSLPAGTPRYCMAMWNSGSFYSALLSQRFLRLSIFWLAVGPISSLSPLHGGGRRMVDNLCNSSPGLTGMANDCIHAE